MSNEEIMDAEVVSDDVSAANEANEASEPTERDVWITDILKQVAEVVGVEVGSVTRVEIRSGEVEVTRVVSVNHDDGSGEPKEVTIRVVNTIPWKWAGNE